MPAVPEVRVVAAMVVAARGDRREEWESNSGATFHMSHTRAGMSAYKKASPGTTVEIADGNILPVDGFGRIEVDLDQPGHTTKMVKMDDVAYVPGLSWNLLSRKNRGGSGPTESHNQDGEDGRCCVCAGTLLEPAVYHFSSGAMEETVNLL